MKTPFLKKKELRLIAIAAAAFAVILLLLQSPAGKSATVSFNGEIVERLDLQTDGIFQIDALLPVTLEVKNGAVRFINSQCPDHVCEGYGWISAPPEHAVCMPAGVVVQAVGE